MTKEKRTKENKEPKKPKNVAKTAVITFTMQGNKLHSHMANIGIPNLVVIGLLEQMKLTILRMEEQG